MHVQAPLRFFKNSARNIHARRFPQLRNHVKLLPSTHSVALGMLQVSASPMKLRICIMGISHKSCMNSKQRSGSRWQSHPLLLRDAQGSPAPRGPAGSARLTPSQALTNHDPAAGSSERRCSKPRARRAHTLRSPARLPILKSAANPSTGAAGARAGDERLGAACVLTARRATARTVTTPGQPGADTARRSPESSGAQRGRSPRRRSDFQPRRLRQWDGAGGL